MSGPGTPVAEAVRLHVRVLDRALPRPDPGVEGAGGARVLEVRLDGVPADAIAAIEREVRSAGGQAHREGGDGGPGTAGPALVLRASAAGFRALALGGLRSEPGLAGIARRIDDALSHRFSRTERVIEGLHRSFRVGSRTAVMGVINVTPDSFSDGGRFTEPDHAVAHALALAAEGAALLDIGGESTRPGALPVSPDAEWRRVAPVLARLHGRVEVPISIDTRRPEVARRALEEGADLVNDVSGLRESEMRRVLARSGAPAIVMHMRGEPATMQDDLAYADLLSEVFDALSDACARAEAEGIAPDRLLIDPGLGFGKSPEDNLELIARVGEFRSLGYPVVIGASRKSFLGWATGGAPPGEREAAGLAAAVAAALRGVDVVRVHDVRSTVRALAIADQLRARAVG
jgi:dihydropteroate synthase